MKCLEKNPNFINYPPPPQLRPGEYFVAYQGKNLSINDVRLTRGRGEGVVLGKPIKDP